MRKVACCFLFASALALAQDNVAEQALRQRLEKLSLINPPAPPLHTQIRLQNAPVAKPGVCAIPLLHVVPPGTADRMTVAKPPAPIRENGDTVKVPAPPCDEKLFTNGPAVTPAPAPKP